jgi:lipopolysaccharide transport system ATP-binding protein
MTEPAIRVQNVSKQYQIGLRETANQTFREAITSTLTAPFRRFQKLAGGKTRESDHFMALTDVSFDVQPGEVVGIIGRNGAGKSTLLKILSRITEPTSGRIELNGRVASLLEVGTGFHPELTGRENVFLNGAILGMSKAEIKRKFDEIVDFSGVDKFLDTAVKKYSSGMKVRLAFSVAAHLEPEILIIDEVLAVGDQSFQQKCMGKMNGVAKSGRTILFVSHQMAAVENLCTRSIVLERGSVMTDGPSTEAIARYCELLSHESKVPLAERNDRKGDGQLRLTSVRLTNSLSTGANVIHMGGDWSLELQFTGAGLVKRPQVGILITTANGQRIARILSTETHGDMPSADRRLSLRAYIQNLNLVPGYYQLLVDLTDLAGGCVDRIDQAIAVEVLPHDVFGRGKITDAQRSSTFCFYDCGWTIDVHQQLAGGLRLND